MTFIHVHIESSIMKSSKEESQVLDGINIDISRNGYLQWTTHV